MKIPYKANILLWLHVSETLPNGESSTEVVDEEILKRFGLNSKMLVVIEGNSLEECLEKVRKKIL